MHGTGRIAGTMKPSIREKASVKSTPLIGQGWVAKYESILGVAEEQFSDERTKGGREHADMQVAFVVQLL